jgi:NAD(P)H-dependent flavin oxidoreductase YrpB (nitropropane dioxygenase family)
METDLTRVLGIRAPIVQGSLGPWTSVELSAAVSEAGGLGSIGTALHELVPFAGQTAGLVHSVLPVRDIVDGMVRDATARLAAVSATAAGVTSAA